MQLGLKKRKKLELQANARKDRVALMEKRNELLISQLLKESCGGIRILTNKTLVKAKTLLTKQRIDKLDFEVLSLKSPWVENPVKWNNILKICQNYSRNMRQLEDRLEKEIFKLRIGDELQQVL